MQDNSNVSFESSSARTWGDVLRGSSSVKGMVSSDMKIVIKQTKAVIESDETILPEGDITIYLFPGKVKAGENEGYDYARNIEILLGPILDEFLTVLNADLDAVPALLQNNSSLVVEPLPF